MQTRLVLSGKRIKIVIIQIVVVTDIKSRAGIRRVAQQKPPVNSRVQSVVIHARSGKGKARKLISGFERIKILVVSCPPGVIAHEAAFDVVKRKV